jgi:hypothetical protein
MTTITDSSLTGSNSTETISAPRVRPDANAGRFSTSLITPARSETAAAHRDSSAHADRQQHRFPAYYLGRPVQIWINALAGRTRLGSVTTTGINRG